MSTSGQMLTVFVLYILVLVGLGVYQGRKAKTDEDFAIGGRKVPGFIAAMSERATGESAWALLGLPGFAYAAGLSSIWVAVGCVTGIITAWALLSWRLREEAEKHEAVSLVDWFAKRHANLGRAIRLFGSLTITFFFFFYVGAQFLGGGKVLNTTFGIDPKLGMILTALIILPYAAYGGFQSVVYTDTLQATMMILALVVAPIIGVFYIASHPGMYANSVFGALSKAGSAYSNIVGGVTGFAAGMVVVNGFSWFFGYLGGQPQLSARFMSIRDKKEAIIARNTGIVWTILAYTGALLIGWIGIAMFGPKGLADAEQVMPSVMLKLFHPALAALFIVAAIAAMLSTADSLLILTSTELTEDIIKPFVYKGRLDPKKGINIARWITVAVALTALGLIFVVPSNLIYTIVSYAWAGIGDPFSVVVLLTLFWKRFNSKAALSTMVIGVLFTIVWIATGMDAQYSSLFMTFVVSLVVGVIATLVTKPDEASA